VQEGSIKLTSCRSLNGFAAKCFLCMLPAPLTIFVVELGGNFFQEAYSKVAEIHRLWAFLSFLLSPHFYHLSPLLPLCFFLRKDKKTDKGPCDLHTMPTASLMPAWPAFPFCKNSVDGVKENLSDLLHRFSPL